MFKFVVLCAAVAVARAGYLSSAVPAASYSSSSYSYAAAPALRYAPAAPALSYAAAAPNIRYDTGYAGAIHAAPAMGYAVPALGYHAAPSHTRTVHAGPAIGYAALAIHAATAVVQQPSILRSFENLGGYTAPALSSYPGTVSVTPPLPILMLLLVMLDLVLLMDMVLDMAPPLHSGK